MMDNLRQALRVALADGDKLAPTELVQEPEPVGWFEGPFGEFRANQLFKHSWPSQTVAWSIPLYLAQPQRPSRSDIKPLTDEEVMAMWHERFAPRVADAIKKAHGIKE